MEYMDRLKFSLQKGFGLDGKQPNFHTILNSCKHVTTMITVGLCFAQAINEDGCSDKGEHISVVSLICRMYLCEPSHGILKTAHHIQQILGN